MAALTDVGLKREINQDSILVDYELGLFIVADGMGGHRGGEVASALAVETLQDFLKRHWGELKKSPKRILVEAYREASARIHHKSTVDSPELMGMGTTMVVFLILDNKAYIANVGDSRVYLSREGNLWQLTEDHSLINEQIKAGMVEEESNNLVGRNVITRSVGFEREVVADVIERHLQSEDLYIICSDGLSSLIPNKKIAECCQKGHVKEIGQRCIAEAKKAGGDDNVSVIVIKVG